MKKYYLLIIICLLTFTHTSYAAGLSFSKTNQVQANKWYEMQITYYDKELKDISSLSFNINVKNAKCVITYNKSNCNGFSCQFGKVSNNQTIIKMSCINTEKNASFSISGVVAKDDLNKSVDVNGSSTNVTANGTITSEVITTENTTSITNVEENTTSIYTEEMTHKTTKTTRKTTEATTTENITEEITSQIIETTLPKTELKLKNLQVIGYNIGFNKNKKKYLLRVYDDVKTLDIVAKPLSDDITVENTGKIDITNLSEINISLKRGNEFTIYTIVIEKIEHKKVNIASIFIITLIGITIIISIIVIIYNRKMKYKMEEEFIKDLSNNNDDYERLLEEEKKLTIDFKNLNKDK